MLTRTSVTRLRGHSAASAARRGMLAAAVLVAALVAHAVGAGGLSIVPIAPAIWAMFIAAAVFVGIQGGQLFRARGALATVMVLLVGQAALHVGITYAPWAFGLNIHHAADVLPGWGPVIAHVLAAVVLAVLIARAELLLAAALRVVQVLVGPARTPAARGAAPRISSPVLVVCIPAHGLRRALPRRGPPVQA